MKYLIILFIILTFLILFYYIDRTSIDIVYNDISIKYPNWSEKTKKDFIKKGKMLKKRLYNNGLKTFIFRSNFRAPIFSYITGPYIKKGFKYYNINKNILNKYFIPLNNTEDAKDYFELLDKINLIPKIKTPLIKSYKIDKKNDYYDNFKIKHFQDCIKDDVPISRFVFKNDIYKIEEIYFNYEEKAFLLKVYYEMDKNGNVILKKEEIIKDCGKGLKEGEDYRYIY